jgi:hypothetical protein
MTRTIKLRYEPIAGFAEVLADQRRRQGRLIRSAYRCLVAGMAQRDLYAALRAHPVGQGLHTWLTLSGMKKASALFSRHPGGKVVFGGRRAFLDRAQGRMSREEWRSAMLMPLYVEGHAKSYGLQGGNHLVTLDIASDRVIYHGPDGRDFPIKLCLSRKSREYRRRLIELQARCETLRDVPFTVTINAAEIALSWNEPPMPAACGIANRVLALDLNPARLGWAVVEHGHTGPGAFRCVAWGVFEYSDFARRLGFASDDRRSLAHNHKRRHELAILAKKVAILAKHYRVSAVVTERLALGPKDHGKGRRYNRLINQVWFRRGLLEPLIRRLQAAGIAHAEENRAFSSKLGNHLWADVLRVPDPACAAVELGRRAIWPARFSAPQKDAAQLPKPNARRRRKDGARAKPRKGPALGGWQSVWSQLQPKAADARRRSRADLRPQLPPGNPRLAPLVNPRSKVLRYEPREGASLPFGHDLHILCLRVSSDAD